MAQWITRLPSNGGGGGVPKSNSTVGKNFSLCKFSLDFLCASQLDKTNANEINRGMHLVNTLF